MGRGHGNRFVDPEKDFGHKIIGNCCFYITKKSKPRNTRLSQKFCNIFAHASL